MDQETKDKLKDFAHSAAEDAAEWLQDEAKASTGILRWVWGVLALLAMGVCAWLGTSCSRVTPEQVQQVHGVYHVVTGEPCLLALPVVLEK